MIKKGENIMKKSTIVALCCVFLGAISLSTIGFAAYVYSDATPVSAPISGVTAGQYFATKNTYYFDSATAGYYKNSGTTYAFTSGTFTSAQVNTSLSGWTRTGSGTNLISAESPSSGTSFDTVVFPALASTWTAQTTILIFFPVTCTVTATQVGLKDQTSAAGNSYLKNIVLRGDYSYIGTNTFASYTSLEQVSFTSQTTTAMTIASKAFYGDSNLSYVTLPSYVSSIGANAFGLASASAQYSLVITFQGTMSAFQAITLDAAWHTNRNVVVTCTDGNLFYKA
jgi:hypothetical protein